MRNSLVVPLGNLRPLGPNNTYTTFFRDVVLPFCSIPNKSPKHLLWLRMHHLQHEDIGQGKHAIKGISLRENMGSYWKFLVIVRRKRGIGSRSSCLEHDLTWNCLKQTWIMAIINVLPFQRAQIVKFMFLSSRSKCPRTSCWRKYMYAWTGIDSDHLMWHGTGMHGLVFYLDYCQRRRCSTGACEIATKNKLRYAGSIASMCAERAYTSFRSVCACSVPGLPAATRVEMRHKV